MSPVPARSTRRIQICADDYGFDAAVSRGVLDCIEAGRLQATSCMVLSPAWPQWAAGLREHRATVDCGLHLDINEFAQQAPGRSLSGWIAAAYLGRIQPQQAHRWVARQLDAFEDAMHAAPDYLDGHQHVHQLPVLRDAVLGELRRRYGRSCALRSTRSRIWRGGKAALIAGLGEGALRRAAHAADLRMNSDFAGVYDFGAEPAYAQRVRGWLSTLEDGGQLMTHPGRVEAPPSRPDGIREARGRELAFWLGPAAADMLASLGISPGRCADWPEA